MNRNLRTTPSGGLEVLNDGVWRTVPTAAALEIDRLQQELVAARILAHEWMKKHDSLLGFIQERPEVLKDLINQRVDAQ